MPSESKLQPIGAGISIYTSDIHKFGTDALLLADFAAPTSKDVACDMGTGCGIIPLLWCRANSPKTITALDIQPDAVELVRQSVEYNGIKNMEVRCADLRCLDKAMHGQYTLVTMNPPYKRVEGGLISPVEGRAIARHELKCTVTDMTAAAAKLLKPSGRLCVCHRPERLADLICAMREAGIEPKRLQTVCQRKESAPMLILCEGVRGGNSGMTLLPPLIIEDESGNYSDKMKRLYRFMEEL